MLYTLSILLYALYIEYSTLCFARNKLLDTHKQLQMQTGVFLKRLVTSDVLNCSRTRITQSLAYD